MYISDSENDYYGENLEIEQQLNQVFENELSPEEDSENIMRESIFKKEQTINNINAVDEPDDDYIVFKPAKEMKKCEKYNNMEQKFNIWKKEISRKDMLDNANKKIKRRFFKSLRKCINEKVTNFSNNQKFEFLPQNFMDNISIEHNKHMLEKTLEEIIEEYKQDKSSKNKNNIDLLEYLKENKNKNDKIKKIYDIFRTRIEQLFNEYLKSKEFENSIAKLEEEGNYFHYIKNYITRANKFIEYFSNSCALIQEK